MIQNSPGAIIGPITRFLGVIFNFVFNIVYNISHANSLGFSIIIITIVVRILLWPLTFKQLKSSVKIQDLQPKIKKIRDKYLNKKDVESQKKLNSEIQKLYIENNINPASGCLLSFIQLPIFIALNRLLSQCYNYISEIGIIYKSLSIKIMHIPGYIKIIKPLAIPKVPKNMSIDLKNIDDMQKVINKFTSTDWTNFLSHISGDTHKQISVMLNNKHSIENLFGINLIDACGLTFPGVIIPVLAVFTTFLSSYLMNKSLNNPTSSNNSMAQQSITLIFMPLLMGWISLSLSSGVGVYWITSSIIQIFQQLFANNYRKKLQEGK